MRICCAIRLAQSNASPGLKIRRNVGTQPASAIPKTFSRNKPNKIFKYIYLFYFIKYNHQRPPIARHSRLRESQYGAMR